MSDLSGGTAREHNLAIESEAREMIVSWVVAIAVIIGGTAVVVLAIWKALELVGLL